MVDDAKRGKSSGVVVPMPFVYPLLLDVTVRQYVQLAALIVREGSSAADVPSPKATPGCTKNEKLATITIAPNVARVFFMSEY